MPGTSATGDGLMGLMAHAHVLTAADDGKVATRRRAVVVGWVVVAVAVMTAAPTAAVEPVERYEPTLTPIAAVIVLGGLGDEHAAQFARREPYGDFFADLASRGIEVVIPNLPDSGPGMATRLAAIPQSQVAAYRADWDRRVRTLVADVRRRNGDVPIGVVGISWGGLHALLAACDVHDFTAVAVHAPVTRPSILTEFSSGSLDALDPTRCRYDEPMWVSWGTRDARVGWRGTARLAARVGAAGRGYDLAHETTPHVLDDIEAWMLDVLRVSS